VGTSTHTPMSNLVQQEQINRSKHLMPSCFHLHCLSLRVLCLARFSPMTWYEHLHCVHGSKLFGGSIAGFTVSLLGVGVHLVHLEWSFCFCFLWQQPNLHTPKLSC